MKIKDIDNEDNGTKVSIKGTVKRVFDVRSFSKRDGTTGKNQNIVVEDDTGNIRLTIWDEKYTVDEGMKISIKNAKVDEYKGEKQLSGGTIDVLDGDDAPKPTNSPKTVDSGTVARQALGVAPKTDVTPLVQELGKIVIVLESMNMKLAHVEKIDNGIGALDTKIGALIDLLGDKVIIKYDDLLKKADEENKEKAKGKK